MKGVVLDKTKLRNGVYYLSEANRTFESNYISTRKKEDRIYSDEEVKLLPNASSSNPHKNEWKLRRKSMERFISHVQKFNDKLNLLDIGCGNGWFSANIAKQTPLNVYALDINKTELEQAAHVFKLNNLKFIYGNIFENIFDESVFDIITLNSSIQYFDNFNKLIKRLFLFLKEKGEIHIIDSPVYNRNELAGAKERTARYYISIDFPEMTKHYFHHTFDKLEEFNYNILYEPKSFLVKLKKLLGMNDSPFPWIRIAK